MHIPVWYKRLFNIDKQRLCLQTCHTSRKWRRSYHIVCRCEHRHQVYKSTLYLVKIVPLVHRLTMWHLWHQPRSLSNISLHKLYTIWSLTYTSYIWLVPLVFFRRQLYRCTVTSLHLYPFLVMSWLSFGSRVLSFFLLNQSADLSLRSHTFLIISSFHL